MATFINLGNTNNTQTLPDGDYVITGDGDNTLTLGTGDDQLTLGDGNNTLTLGTGTDQITAGAGNNTVTAGDGNNLITLGNGFDQVTTGNGNSQIAVGDGAGDTITTGTGSNTITLGTGSADVVSTGSGNNSVTVAAAALAADTVMGGLTSNDGSQNKLTLTTAGAVGVAGVSGFETYQLANGAPNTLTLTNANFARLPGGSITVEGGDSGSTVDASGLSAANAVIIHASPGVNTLTGGAGDDTFYSAPGTSTVDGGAGVNTMIFSGPRSSYTVSVAGPVTTVTGPNSVDTLTNIQQIDFTEPPPTVLGLDPASDSGISNSDDITNVAMPTVVGSGTAGDTISLYDSNDNLIIPSSAFDDPLWVAFGTTPVVTPNVGPGPDGGDSTADEVTLSDANSGLFYRTSPAGLSTFSVWVKLLSGNGNFALNYFNGSTNTADTKPVIATGAWQQVSLTFTGDGNAQSNVAVIHDATEGTSGSFEFWGAQLLTAIGTTTAGSNGNWSTAVTTPLTEGVNPITATEAAVSGDTSAPSTPLNVTLDTTVLSPTTLALDPADESGNSANTTNVPMPTITGTGEDGATVTLLDGGTTIGTGTVANGVWSVTPTTALTEGVNAITATQTDVAGNVSAPSSTLDVTLDTTPANFSILDTTTNVTTTAAGDAYSGPVTGLQHQFFDITTDSLNITSLVPDAFIHSGSGTDGIDVSQANGNNVLDGGAGSSFLTGGTGNDTFYMDNRTPPTSPVFSTIANFHSGDDATIWGVNPTDFTMFTLDNQGAAGFTGLDFVFTSPNQMATSFVLAGFTSADLTNGRLSQSYGTTPDMAGVSGSEYMTIHAN